MVVSLDSYENPIYSVDDSSILNGAVRVSSNGYYGTGTLLYGGMAILTSAHLFLPNNLSADVTFETSSGRQTIASESVEIIPYYDSNGNNDLAIVWLAEPAPYDAYRYELYRDNDEIGKQFTAVGYGATGVGATGADTTITSDMLRLQTTNKFETDAATLKDSLGSIMYWTPLEDTILVADFDDGTYEHDALGNLIGEIDLGNGNSEGMIAPGDSGGPAIIDSKVAGVASYVSSLGNYYIDPDVDTEINSSFGEVGFWQKVSYYQQWIDQSLRQNYTNTPQTSQEVQKEIVEGATGEITVNYFLVEVIGMRDDPNEWLSVNYTTRDGTATAYQDYIPTSGTLVLYPDENYAHIPVEILGDNTIEEDEIFYLDIFDPIGATFSDNQIVLTAQRTIINDDGYLFV
ncbi:Calx-beta domain-containing protein [Sulfurimonas sp.]|jgi:secreted trypsin-like serine protease|uniref:Calx-beta domain-containing protein n=1 Tax=Sulfurimonas sp. TaxID=2022749 RepID=UPI0025FB84C2|nr:Calx-beta domain-containing protein [Sulfurimonas sp.]MCK9473167.1 trypsin-like serine protease [Sulfurimonas sp.]MDD3506739.1 Calx-beta domain-containing protein [Sulfurimonas sp.]